MDERTDQNDGKGLGGEGIGTPDGATDSAPGQRTPNAAAPPASTPRTQSSRRGPTIRDVARAATVSAATVSRVLNNDETLSVTPATRARILAAAERLGYHKNHQTRERRSHRAKRIAIVEKLTEVYESEEMFSYYIRSSLSTELTRMGYDVLRIQGDADNATRKTVGTEADGIAVIGLFTANEIERMKRGSRPIIAIYSDTLLQQCTCVTPDFESAAIQALDHFLTHGLKRIGLLCTDVQFARRNMLFDDPFLRTFRDYLSQLGLYVPGYVYRGGLSTELGFGMMRTAIREHPDDLPQAFLCCADALAVGALQALHEAGLRVPEDVSLISFQGTPVVRQTFPQLTSLTVDTTALGVAAARLLDAAVRREFTSEVPYKVAFKTTLELRGTTLNDEKTATGPVDNGFRVMRPYRLVNGIHPRGI